MSVVGSPIDSSLVQAAQAQQVASKARDREKASDAARRLEDRVELRVSGVEGADAVRRLPANDSEQAESEHRADEHGQARGHVDVRA